MSKAQIPSAEDARDTYGSVPLKLSERMLPRIAGRASVPSYDRSLLRPGILHFGVGNFHRAHQAVFLDTLFNAGRDHDWAIVGAGVLASDARMRETLAAQDYLTTVVEQAATGRTARVTGPMIDFLPAGDAAAIVAALADPAIRIVSLTITEGGYFIDPATGVFNSDDPGIVADAAQPHAPKTVFGIIAAGLKRRRASGIGPFTVLSCDNLPHNGRVTREAVAGLVELTDPDLADWVRREVAFPNAMVDRITPATGERERRYVAEHFGIDDAAPVFCEDFSQWVLQDEFSAGRPALDEAGVELVSDVAPYEAMKIRILNGGHAVIGYPAALLGVHFVHEAMAVPLVGEFLEKVEREEILPHVEPAPNTALEAYFGQVKQRFANPNTGDTVRRLCLDGSNRQPKFIVPTIRDRMTIGGDVTGLALESALWCRYCFGKDEAGTVIEPNDPDWNRLVETARAARSEPAAWLAMEDIYGDVGRAAEFSERFATALASLWSRGTETTVRAYLADEL